VERKERGGEVTAGGPAQSRTNSLDSVANSFQHLPVKIKKIWPLQKKVRPHFHRIFKIFGPFK
jgi:hypothetical protein